MAAITFSYRSPKKESELEIRLSFRVPGKKLSNKTGKEMPFSFYTRSGIKVEKKLWDEIKKGTNFQDGDKIIISRSINDSINSCKDFLTKQLISQKLEDIDSKWLKDAVHKFHNQPKKDIPLPTNLIEYYDYYLDLRRTELSEKVRSWQKWNTVKNKLSKMISSLGKDYLIEDVNEEFVRDWIDYCKKEGYSNQTTKKEFSYIKTVCVHAKRKKLDVSEELEGLRVILKSTELPKIYLSFKELEKIKALSSLPPYLNNARDWLLISCFTGQRVSDFMRFNTSMIREDKGAKFLDIKQVKTGKDATIPILPIVEEVLEKNNGSFPKPISDQKYNDYVKEVARLAGIDEVVKGGIRINNRKKVGMYPKWKLISSHVGRRSLATNYYGKIPTTFLKNITMHGTEAMLLAYIGKTSKDTAKEAYELLIKVG